MSPRKVHNALTRLRDTLAEEGIDEVNLKLTSMDDGILFARLFDLQPKPVMAPGRQGEPLAYSVLVDAKTIVSWTTRSKAEVKAQRDEQLNRVRLRRENCPPIGAVA